jgi:hypothetical protein
MENQHVVTSPVTRPAAVVIPAAGTYRVAGHRPTIPAATRHLFAFTIYDTFGMADGEIHIAEPPPGTEPHTAQLPNAGALLDEAFGNETG